MSEVPVEKPRLVAKFQGSKASKMRPCEPASAP